MRVNGNDKERILIERERDIQRQVIEMKIREARYSSMYKEIEY